MSWGLACARLGPFDVDDWHKIFTEIDNWCYESGFTLIHSAYHTDCVARCYLEVWIRSYYGPALLLWKSDLIIDYWAL